MNDPPTDLLILVNNKYKLGDKKDASIVHSIVLNKKMEDFRSKY